MRRAIRNLIRFIAAGLTVFGGLIVALEFIRHRMQNAEIRPSQFLLAGALILGGILLFALGTRLAEMFTDDDDDDSGKVEIPPDV